MGRRLSTPEQVRPSRGASRRSHGGRSRSRLRSPVRKRSCRSRRRELNTTRSGEHARIRALEDEGRSRSKRDYSRRRPHVQRMDRCCACPEENRNAPSAAIKSSGRSEKAADGKKEPCPCRTCCCGKPPIIKPCYKQPRIPESYAPRRCYIKPSARVESGTTYKMSFLPVDGDVRGVPSKPVGNIVTSSEPMQGHTVQQLSYLPNPVCVTQTIKPCHHDMWGRGPMQTITTQRHDFVPKASEIRESFKPDHKLHVTEQPFEHRTVNKLSFMPPENFEASKSFAPSRCYKRPKAKMEGTTVNKLSYKPNKILPKEPIPWRSKEEYQKPSEKLEGHTTYGMSYLDVQSDCRRQAIIPNFCSNPVTCSKEFESKTIYKDSYLPAKVPIPRPVRPESHFRPSNAQMEADTVQKLSYLPNPVCVTRTIRPCHHDMWGHGPMQNITTQRHDYVPKASEIRESYKPANEYRSVEHPFEDRTINRMSFLDPGRCKIPESYAPVKCYERPAAKMEMTTTQKMSYRKVRAKPPQRPPWACKEEYQKPSYKLECTSVYRSSFIPPGEDCSEYIDPCEYGDCKPCECVCPAECITKDPCACDFPKAACCA